MPDPFVPSTRFHETMLDLRLKATDVTQRPHRQLAAKVFQMSHDMFMQNWDNPVHLRRDISPEMLEAAVARIFGKKIHEKLVVAMPQMQKLYADHDGDDIYQEACQTRPLLGEIATQAAWGTPATEDADKLAHLLIMLMGPWGDNVNRFVVQAQKRLAMH